MTKAKRKTAPRAAGPAAPPRREGTLRWLARRNDKDGRPLLSAPQVEAGERLARDFWRAQLEPRVTANWSAPAPSDRTRRSVPGFGVDMSDAAVAARQRFHRALDAVGAGLAGLLVDVCCRDIGLAAAEERRRWPPRSAKVVLDVALTALARHYGLIAPERPWTSRPRHWGDADYRPTLEKWR
jgi:Domain of unknown function (DUF6456)